jgi:hypothetical protein
VTYFSAYGALAPIDDDIRSRSTPAKTNVLLCGKCARKMDGGYGPPVTVVNASNPGMVFIVPAGMSSARALKLVIGPAD